MDIGFIGLGNMGYPMARRLVEAGHKLIVYDTNGQMVSRLTNLGAVAAKSPKDVADQVETVMASLPTPDIVDGGRDRQGRRDRGQEGEALPRYVDHRRAHGDEGRRGARARRTSPASTCRSAAASAAPRRARSR